MVRFTRSGGNATLQVDSWPVIERYPAGKPVNVYPGKILGKTKWKTKHCFAFDSPNCGFSEKPSSIYWTLESCECTAVLYCSWYSVQMAFCRRPWRHTLSFAKFRTSVKPEKRTHKRHNMAELFFTRSLHSNKGKALSKVTQLKFKAKARNIVTLFCARK